jgi:transglutaminase-like putative cysteine protease
VSILFIIVFGIIGVISGAFGYYMGEIELFFIVFWIFILYSIINKYKKWVILFMVALMSIGVGVAIYYYRNENLDVVIKPIQDFINTYYYSVILDGYYISHGYQAVLIAFISLLLFYVYHFFYRRKKLQWMPIIVGFIFAITAFLSDTLTTPKDHRAFLFFLMSSVIYYFAVYSSRNDKDIGRRQRYTFYGMGIIFALGIVGFGMFFNHYRPNPFEKKIQSTTVSSNMLEDNNESREYERSVVQDIADGSYQVQSSFEHEGIAVFSVDADTLKYYVTDVYDIYEEGVWLQSRDEWLTPSIEYDESLYERETVEIIYENIITNRLLLSPHWDAINISEEMQSLAAENGILERGFNYTIDAVIPRYRTSAWQEAIEQMSNGESIEGFMQISEEFDRLQELAQEVTEGASTDYEKGRRIEAYLSSEYLYNETPEYGSTDDMIHAFLFETQEGFCQQFASSMVMMMRSVGIPSRFVVGYVLNIEAYDDIPDSLMYAYGEVPEEKIIYDHNAHAWVESYFQE